jgi:hypothetical protein
LGITKEQIERRRPYQSYIETTFGIQKRMADWHFAKAETFADLARAHDTWREDYNAKKHWAHEKREDGRRSPQDVLGFYTALLRHREEDLRRAFFSTRSTRVLDALGYARFLDWRLYGKEALPRREVAVWLQPESLTFEYGGETLSAYDVELARETGRPSSVKRAPLFETSYWRIWPQARLFALDEAGWLKAMRLEGYAPRRATGPVVLEEVLFSYLEAL